MPNYTTPGVYFEFVDQAATAITAIRTDIAAFVGVAEKGPLHTPAAANSWAQFQAVFGGFLPNAYLAYAAKAFFENGGRHFYGVRVAAPVATTVTVSPMVHVQPADRSSSFVVSVEGFIAGAVVTVKQGSLRYDHLLQAVDSTSVSLIWQQPLEPAFNLTQPIEFATGAAAATGDLLDSNGHATVRVQAITPGAWGDGLAVRVVQSSPAATRTVNTPLPQPPGREASRVESVTGFRKYSLVKIFQPHSPTDLVTYRRVADIDPGSRMLIWDTPLSPTYNLAQPISLEVLEFSLSVLVKGEVQEIFSGLSLVPGHARYVEKIAGPGLSNYVQATDLHSPSAPPGNLPDPTAPNLFSGVLALANGRDGIAALTPADFTGDPGSETRQGLRALEDVEEVSMVAIPDILIQPVPPVLTVPQPRPQPDPCLPCSLPAPVAPPPAPALVEKAPTFSLTQVYLVQQALVAHAETQKNRIAILDPPIFSAPSESIGLSEIQSWKQRFDSTYAALYYPWVVVYDPLASGSRIVRAIPPSGHTAGVYANSDLTIGVHKAPANVALEWAQDVTAAIDAASQGILNPLGINCIRAFAGRGLRIYGARTVSSDPVWRYVNVRRLLMMIEEAVRDSIQWSVFEPNNFYLRQMLAVAISGFLEALWEKGALAGATPSEAFYVKCDDSNNPPSVTDLGEVIAEVGVAPSIPAEFVVFRIGRTENTLQVTE